MSGLKPNTRTTLRLQREERLATFIAEGRPVSAVALLEVIDHDYAYRLLMDVAKLRGLEYRPKRVPQGETREIPGLTSASHSLRARLGNALYGLTLSSPDLAKATGITSKAQTVAKNRPFNYDWKLSQIERLANQLGVPFEEFLLRALLTPRELALVSDRRAA